MATRIARVDAQGLEAAVDRCFEAVLRPDQWPGALEALGEASGSTGAVAFTFGERERASFLCSERCAGPLDTYIRSGWVERNPRLLRPPRPGISSDVDFERDPRTAPIVRSFREDFLRKHDLGWFAGAPVFRDSSRLVLLSIERCWRHEPFETSELAILARAFDRIGKAVAMAPGFDDALRAALLDGLQWQRQAAVVVGAGGRVLQMNEAAERVVPLALASRSGFLRPLDRRAGGAFGAFVGRLTRSAGTSERVPPDPLPLATVDGRLLVVRGMPLPALAADLFAKSRAILLLTVAGCGARPDEALMRGAFRLTAAEARLVAALILTPDLRAAARANDIGYETARFHLKSAFAKTGTHRQAELVALMTSL